MSRDQSRVPNTVALCPGEHLHEFYVPDHHGACPECSEQTEVYVRVEAVVAAIVERYCDTSQGIVCSDFRKAADFVEQHFSCRHENDTKTKHDNAERAS